MDTKKTNFKKTTKPVPRVNNPSARLNNQSADPRVNNPRVNPTNTPLAAAQANNPTAAPSTTLATPLVSNQNTEPVSTIDLSSLRAAMPVPAGPGLEETGWSLVRTKKRASKKPNPSKKTRNANRAKARVERQARCLTSGGSKRLEVAEGPEGAHVAPASDVLPRGEDESQATGKCTPVGAPPAKTPVAAKVPSRQGQPGQGKRARRATRGGKPSSETKPVKRTRPDESRTPQGSGKRFKPLPKTGSTSYSDALKANDLCVAVMLEPYHDLTKAQAEAIEGQLQGVLDEEIFSPGTSSAPVAAPQFRGKAFYSEGALKMWCNDEYALQWLRRSLVRIPSPREGTKLVVRRQSEIPKRIKAGLLVPQIGPDDTLVRIQTRLKYQNSQYNVANWALYHAEAQEEKKCLFLVLGIPEEDVVKLKASERRVYYKLGNLCVRFLDERPAPPTNPDEEPESAPQHPKDGNGGDPLIPVEETACRGPPPEELEDLPVGESDLDDIEDMLNSDDGAVCTPP
ncbi:unnamed protein product [Arctia plantaginis]|uniref:DUF4780 domain-containing protein n=1 Tax=Arctia plantaginis TaxID=874455 RepID=A0A8S1BAW9_ARCPL|nr:unnamed protein product [Arctia plantaginis]